jgi:polyribonucleotide nucleotidyltransferase
MCWHHALQPWQLEVVWDEELSRALAQLALQQGSRLDGRALGELREVGCALAPLPRVVHGSALFHRGDTQVLASATVGSERDVLEVVGPLGQVRKSFMLHYAFPPWSVNETGALPP